ncbi:MAG: sialate O-acetylesterase [Lentisphaeria bacterium]|nr:sialate O-acetylesterase [Lentisphaeria bacterium]
MRYFSSLFALLFGVCSINAAETPDEIYLLIGQSNMAGRATITPELSGELSGAMLLNAEGKWEAAKNPLNRYSTIRKGLNMQKLGVGYGFAREMIAQRPRITVGLVVNAKGGTKIDLWQEGSKFFNDAVARAKQAVAAGGALKGICWHQGESNADDPDYLKKMTALVIALRKELGDKDLPFVVGETCKAQKERPVNEQLRQLPKTVPHTACVSAEELKAQDGNTHFDTVAQLEIGKRYATEMLKLLK